jgi:hypothetical protein
MAIGKDRFQFGRADCKCKSVSIALNSIEHRLGFSNLPDICGTEEPPSARPGRAHISAKVTDPAAFLGLPAIKMLAFDLRWGGEVPRCPFAICR